MKYLPKKELLSYEEIIRLVRVFSEMGIRKLRITGGEPFVRKDVISLMTACHELEGIEQIHITTNGVLTLPHIKDFKKAGIKSVNLSIDSLDRNRFEKITRYDELPIVMKSFYALLEADITLKINMVVMHGKNEEDILPMAALSSKYPVDVRYIEEMPFKGEKEVLDYKRIDHKDILQVLKNQYPSLKPKTAPANSTSELHTVDGFKGTLGIIPAFSRTFCGSCNRIRLTSQGELKTCLYGDASLNLKEAIRNGLPDEAIKSLIMTAIHAKPKDGFAAESARENSESLESMSTIGG